jgi:hypothetical protein
MFGGLTTELGRRESKVGLLSVLFVFVLLVFVELMLSPRTL